MPIGMVPTTFAQKGHQHLPDETEAQHQGHSAIKKLVAFSFRQRHRIGDMHLDRLVEVMINLFEAVPGDRQIQVEAEGFPLAIPPFDNANESTSHNTTPRRIGASTRPSSTQVCKPVVE